jgi:hypothetical protein
MQVSGINLILRRQYDWSQQLRENQSRSASLNRRLQPGTHPKIFIFPFFSTKLPKIKPFPKIGMPT